MPSESRRRLAPTMRMVDALLDRWAAWSRGELERLGHGKSMSQKLIEWHRIGVAPESYNSLRANIDCPDGVLLIDRLVGKLEHPQHDALCEQYFTYAPLETKARNCGQSESAFRRNVDRALHSIRHALAVLEVRFDVDVNIKTV